MLAVLEAFAEIQNRLDPPLIPAFAARLEPLGRSLSAALAARLEEANENAGQPAKGEGSILTQAAGQLLQSVERFCEARVGPHAILRVFQALRPLTRAHDILYPLAARFAPVSDYFLDPSVRQNPALLARLGASAVSPVAFPEQGAGQAAAPDAGAGHVARVGLSHHDNQRGKRGGYSLYVPEYYSPEKAWPLVVALHGGSGHGADFIWSWVAAARSFGFVVAAPTSRARTWSLQAPAQDAAGLNRMLASISRSYHIDTDRLLLNGISDGGTFAMLLSVVHQSPFTHYAPVAAAVHVLMDRGGVVRAPVRDLPIYQVHGQRDWMFPVSKAREVAAALEQAGARITYREVEDLSHNYPMDENSNIVRWFCPELFA